MNFALSSHVLMAHWVPGFILVIAVRPILLRAASPVLSALVGYQSSEAIATLSVIVVSFFAGEVLDASRDLLEHLWDRFQPVTWSFFNSAEPDKVEKLRTSWFTYYVFDFNVSMALVILLVVAICSCAQAWVIISLVLFIAIFIVNAWQLRKEIAQHTASS